MTIEQVNGYVVSCRNTEEPVIDEFGVYEDVLFKVNASSDKSAKEMVVKFTDDKYKYVQVIREYTNQPFTGIICQEMLYMKEYKEIKLVPMACRYREGKMCSLEKDNRCPYKMGKKCLCVKEKTEE